MATITSAACVAEINKRWSTDARKSPKDWKRISKTGTASTSIVRIFEHRTLAEFATVVEEGGQITTVTFSQTRPQPTVAAKSRRQASADQVVVPAEAASNGKAVASDYIFAITRREDGLTYFAVSSIKFWKENDCLDDEGYNGLLDGLLPKGAGESSECQFCTRMGKKALTKFLIERGFKQDEEFSEYMGNDEDFED